MLKEKDLRGLAGEINNIFGLKPPINTVLDVESMIDALRKVIMGDLREPQDVFSPESEEVWAALAGTDTYPEIEYEEKDDDEKSLSKQIDKAMKLRELKDVVMANIEFKTLRPSLDSFVNVELLRDKMFEMIAEMRMNKLDELIPKQDKPLTKTTIVEKDDETIVEITPVNQEETESPEENPVDETSSDEPEDEGKTFILKINPDFRDACPPLTESELQGLEELILRDGKIIQPIIIWKRTIVDGHNRYAIARKHGLPFPVQEMSFRTNTDAVTWIKENALSQRNLPAFVKFEMMKDLEDVLKKIGKQKQIRKHEELSNLVEKEFKQEKENFSSRKELSKKSGLSEGQIAKAKVIDKKADEVTKDELRKGKTTINAIHKKLNKKEPSVAGQLVSAAKELDGWVNKYSDVQVLEPFTEDIKGIAGLIKGMVNSNLKD